MGCDSPPPDLHEAQSKNTALAGDRGVLLEETASIAVRQQRRAASAFPACRFNFEAFFEARRQALVDLIRTTMGKSPVLTEELLEPVGEPFGDEEESDDDVAILEAA